MFHGKTDEKIEISGSFRAEPEVRGVFFFLRPKCLLLGVSPGLGLSAPPRFVLVCGVLDISTKSGVQGQQCPLYPGTLEPVSYSLEGALKDSSNPTVRQAPFVSPQLVSNIGSFYKTGLS